MIPFTRVEYFISDEMVLFLTPILARTKRDRQPEGDSLPDEDMMRLLDWFDPHGPHQNSEKIIRVLEIADKERNFNIIPVKELGPAFYYFLKAWLEPLYRLSLLFSS